MKISIKEMRIAISSAYNSKSWHERVFKMGNRQVVAIYNSMRDSPRYKLVNGQFIILEETIPKQVEEYHQMDIWEYFNSIGE